MNATQSQSQSYVTTDGQSPSLSWCRASIWGPKTRFLLLSRSCEFVDVGASLTRGRVCHLQLLLVLAVILGSESHGTHGHILLSQIRDCPNLEGKVPVFTSRQEQGDPVIPQGTGFTFRRLLRLVGLRWRYSNPPPHGEL
jgi:hypothetical protein